MIINGVVHDILNSRQNSLNSVKYKLRIFLTQLVGSSPNVIYNTGLKLYLIMITILFSVTDGNNI